VNLHGICLNYHAGLYRSTACGHQPTVNLYQAESAGTTTLQLWMIAKVGDIDIILEGGCQD